MDLYGFTVDHAHLSTLCCTVVDNMSVAGTKAAIPDMLESVLEHEILHEG